MSAMIGADIGQLRATASGIATAGEALAIIEQDLTARLRCTAWVSEAGDRFRSEWNSAHLRALVGVSTTLCTVSRELFEQADQQERVSEGPSGALVIGGSCPVPPPAGDIGEVKPGLNLIPPWVKGVVDAVDLGSKIEFVEKHLPFAKGIGKFAGRVGMVMNVAELPGAYADLADAWSEGNVPHIVGQAAHLGGIVLPIGAAAVEEATLGLGTPIAAGVALGGMVLEGSSYILTEDVIQNFEWPTWSQVSASGWSGFRDNFVEVFF